MSFPGLMNDFTEECTLLEKTRTQDGEGGWIVSWSDGPTFNAAVAYDTSLDAKVAESEGMKSVYTVTVERGKSLEFHDVFRRNRDKKVFRVTSDSDDKQTPNSATFQLCQVSAEEWELT